MTEFTSIPALTYYAYKQSFFSYRIRVLSSSWLLASICWALSFLRAVSLIAVGGTARVSPTVVQFKHDWLWLLVTSLAISTATDILIAAILCYYLWNRRDTRLASTKTVVNKLIAWTIRKKNFAYFPIKSEPLFDFEETGLLTGLLSEMTMLGWRFTAFFAD
ncbi:hypothetical protein C0991_001543, partial [Blastosporella zonata]